MSHQWVIYSWRFAVGILALGSSSPEIPETLVASLGYNPHHPFIRLPNIHLLPSH